MPNYTIAIDIGPQQVKVLKMAYVRGEVVLEAVEIEKFSGDTTAMPQQGSVWEDVVGHAVKEAYLKLKTNFRKVMCLSPGSSTVLRSVSLPPVPRYKLDKLIEYEVVQHMPGDGSGSVVGHQALRSKEGYNLLIGISRDDVLNARIKQIEGTGLKVESIGISAFSLVNVYLFNYDVEEGIIGLLNIGADQTDFVILEDGIPVYVRMIPLGGDLITREIAKENRLSEIEAQKFKEESGKVLTSDETDNPDEEKISRVIKSAFNSILKEIDNSVRFYRKERGKKEADIEKLYLSGGTSLLHGIDKYLQDYTGIDTEFLNPIKRIRLQPGFENVRSISQSLAVGIGLGLQGLGVGSLNVSLLPEEIRKSRESRRKAKYTIPSMALLFTLAFTPIIETGMSLKYNKDKLANVNRELKKYEPSLPEIIKLRGEIKDIETKIDILKGLKEKNTCYPEILSILTKLTPEEIYFSSFLVKPSLEKGIEYLALKGTSPSYEMIEKFSGNIESSRYFESIKITQVEDKAIGESISSKLDFMAYITPKERW